ncbi:MAG: PIN domain-containing protein [Lachnospiraceae bacterium]|nr:PIN domain-containing protein [Lachnospiraceae bacterium]
MVLNRSGCNISMELFRKVKEIRAGAYITAASVTDIFFIIRKETHDTRRLYVVMDNIFRVVSVLSVTEQDIKEAFGKKWKDFEDCVQYTTGKNNRIDYIITVNHKDYEDDLLPVITPAAWIEMIDHTQRN